MEQKQNETTEVKNNSFFKSKKKLGLLLLFIILTILITLPLFFQEEFKKLQTLGVIGVFFINLLGSATFFLPTPALISTTVGMKLYNPYEVAFVAALGSTIGDGLGFLLGVTSKELLGIQKRKLLYHLLEYFFKKYGSIIIFLLAALPNPLFDGIGILAGITSYSPRRFALYMFSGRLLRNIILAFMIGAL